MAKESDVAGMRKTVVTEEEVVEWLDLEVEDLMGQVKQKLGDDDYCRAERLLLEAVRNVF